MRNGPPIPHSLEAENILIHIYLLEHGLSKWWADCESEILFKDIAPDRIHPSGIYITITREYSSHEIAECIAYYEACRLMISVMKAVFSRGSTFIACRSEAVAQTAAMLSVVPWCAARSTTSEAREFYAVLGVLILAIVASPKKLQRDYATDILESWGPPDGLGGGARKGPLEKRRILKTR
jgi:hypothetical protein